MKTITMKQRMQNAGEGNPFLLEKMLKSIAENRIVSADTARFYVQTIIGMGRVRTVRHFTGRQLRVLQSIQLGNR